MSKLLDEVRNKLRVHHDALKTGQSHPQWIKRFIIFHQKEPGQALDTLLWVSG